MRIQMSGEICFVFGLASYLLETIHEDRIFWTQLNISAPPFTELTRSIRITGITRQRCLMYGHRVDATFQILKYTDERSSTFFKPTEAVLKIASTSEKNGVNETFSYDKDALAKTGWYQQAVEQQHQSG